MFEANEDAEQRRILLEASQAATAIRFTHSFVLAAEFVVAYVLRKFVRLSQLAD
jgi:hypothetical protein